MPGAPLCEPLWSPAELLPGCAPLGLRAGVPVLAVEPAGLWLLPGELLPDELLLEGLDCDELEDCEELDCDELDDCDELEELELLEEELLGVDGVLLGLGGVGGWGVVGVLALGQPLRIAQQAAAPSAQDRRRTMRP